MALAAALVAVALGAYAAARFRAKTPRGTAPADSLEAMDATQALNRGVELAQQRSYVASLPYFGRAAKAGDSWLVHWDFAAALNNSSFEIRNRNGVAVPAGRSSIERVDWARRALAEVALAARLAPDRRTRAKMDVVSGQTLELWGFPVDALETYRHALRVDSTFAAARRKQAECLARLAGERSPPAQGRPGVMPN